MQKVLKIRGGGGGGDGGSGGVAPTVSWSSGILHNGSWSSSQIAMRESWSSAIAIASIAPIAGIATQMRDATGGQLQSGCSGSIVSAIGDGSRRSGSIVSTSVGQGGRSSIVTTIGGQASTMTGSGQLDLSCGRSVSHGGVAGLRSD